MALKSRQLINDGSEKKNAEIFTYEVESLFFVLHNFHHNRDLAYEIGVIPLTPHTQHIYFILLLNELFSPFPICMYHHALDIALLHEIYVWIEVMCMKTVACLKCYNFILLMACEAMTEY